MLQTGASPTVTRAVAESGQTRDVEVRRELRQHFLSRAQVLAALANERLRGPKLGDYLGDLQMHSVWSDGSQTLEEIVKGGLDRGYAFCAVTDHSYGLPIARGVSMARLEQQHQEIDRINRHYRGRFRLLQGSKRTSRRTDVLT